jgi:putative ABC transport system permease protein
MAESKRIYRLLLKLYPARFREEYAGPLERQFLDEYREASGPLARSLFWMRALRDVAATVPGEIVGEMRQDFLYAARIYRKRSLVTALALLALAMAIGATTGVFSVLNALLLRSLPFREPDRLVQLWQGGINVGGGRAQFLDAKARSPYLADAAGYTSNELSLSDFGDARRVIVTETSANFFALLGAEPQFGRSFSSEEDTPGQNSVAVISESLWRELSARDSQILGSTIRLNGTPMTVIGVAPARFDYPAKTSVWTPTIFEFKHIPKEGLFWTSIGRLKPGVALRQAQAMFETEVAQRSPESLKRERPNRPELLPLRDQLAGPIREASVVLLGGVTFVLLIACANVAQLLLSRVSERRQELTLRAALGASRSRLVQQLITESTLLTFIAAAAGLGVAYWAARLASAVQPGGLITQQYTILDWRVLGFTSGLAVLTGIVFGVLPASLAGRMQPSAEVVRDQPGQSTGTQRMRQALNLIQAALAIMLLAGSLTMGRSFLKMMDADLGYRTDHIVTMNASLVGTSYAKNGSQVQYFSQALDRLRAIPGVESAAAIGYLPLILGKMRMATGFRVEDGPYTTCIQNFVTPEYFATIGTPVIAGRDFTDADREGLEPVVIVSRDFIGKSGSTDVIGRELSYPQSKTKLRIVGVVRTPPPDNNSMKDLPIVYFPVSQSNTGFMTFVARVRGKPEPYLAISREAIQQVDRSVPVYDAQTLDKRFDDYLAKPRFYTTCIAFFGGFALLLAVIGIYGVASYSIAQRTKEIGVRIAVGASPGAVRGMLLRESLWPLALGMAAGVGGAIGLGHYLQHLMASAEPVGKWSCAAAAVLLISAAAVAVWRATARVVRIDPMTALRAE